MNLTKPLLTTSNSYLQVLKSSSFKIEETHTHGKIIFQNAVISVCFIKFGNIVSYFWSYHIIGCPQNQYVLSSQSSSSLIIKQTYNICVYGMCNEMFLTHNINIIFTVYIDELQRVYKIITVCGMMISHHVYHYTVEITCSWI